MTLKIILGYFDRYFFYLMLVHCLILILIDAYKFKKEKDRKNLHKSKVLGYGFLIATVTLVLVNSFIK
ncbi:MAG: CLC_0170 family protein [Clostridiaceae bacterium]